MTLKRQLCLVITVLFLVIFLGMFIISVKNTQEFLNSYMKSEANNTAHSLAVSISQHSLDDTSTLGVLIDSFFKTGTYKSIIYKDANQDVVLERTLELTNPNAPAWLEAVVPIREQVGKSFVNADWMQAGEVTVTSDTRFAYNKLWDDMVASFWVLLSIAIATALLGFMALRYLLKPLQDMRMQAAAICSQDFSVINPLPKTKELATVVDAMNMVSAKVHAMFDEQSKLTDKLREQAYRDHLTGLGNRRYFTMQLENYLQSPDEFSSGSLYLLQLKNLDDYKKAHGFEASELYIKRIAETLSNMCNDKNHFLACRLSDREFIMLSPNVDHKETKAVAEKLSEHLNELHTNIATTITKYHLGVACYKQNQTPSEFLAEADMALRAAQAKGESGWHIYDADELRKTLLMGAAAWQKQLDRVIENRNIIFHYQPVKNVRVEAFAALHYEVLLRIPDQENNLLNAGIFIPMAENLNRMIDLDKMVIEKIITHVESNQKNKFAVNLSPSSINDEAFTNWLFETMAENPTAAKNIILEFPEQVAIHNVESLRAIINRLHKLGCEFSLDHFGRGFASFTYLKNIQIDYLKIDGSYVRHIDQDTGNQFFVHVVTEIAHNLGIKTIAENVETQQEMDMLQSLNVDGVQGYYIGKPSDQL